MSNVPVLLVAVDLTTRPVHICEAAAEMAERLGARAVLLNVVTMPTGVPGDAVVAVDAEGHRASAGDILAKDADAQLHDLEARFTARSVEVETCHRSGDVVEMVVACAKELDALMIVIGADTPMGLRRLFTQGFTMNIVKASDRPVLVVPVSPDEAVRGASLARASVAAEADG